MSLISSFFEPKQVRVCNELLAAQLGNESTTGFPRFRWVWGPELRGPVRLAHDDRSLVWRLRCQCCEDVKNTHSYVHKPSCTGIVARVPAWRWMNLVGEWHTVDGKDVYAGWHAPDGGPADKRWVLAFKQPKTSREYWEETYHQELSYEGVALQIYDTVTAGDGNMALALAFGQMPDRNITMMVCRGEKEREKVLSDPLRMEKKVAALDKHEKQQRADFKEMLIEAGGPYGKMVGKAGSGVVLGIPHILPGTDFYTTREQKAAAVSVASTSTNIPTSSKESE